MAEFLASQTAESTSGDTQDVDVVADILMNIVQAGSGEKQVGQKSVMSTALQVYFLT